MLKYHIIFYFRKSSLEKIAVDIKSPKPVLTNAQVVNENMISIKFDVNIKGPRECHANDPDPSYPDPLVCCYRLFEYSDEYLRKGYTPSQLGKRITILT